MTCQPYNVGDHVTVNGEDATVTAVSLLSPAEVKFGRHWMIQTDQRHTVTVDVNGQNHNRSTRVQPSDHIAD